MRFSSSSLLAGTAIALMATPAVAQIDEIIVTAEKRAESVQDVSASITALTDELLDANGINDVTRLDLLVPGVNFAFIGNDAKFNVRGANSNNTFNDAASIVGTFIDGVYKTRASQQTRSFYDIDRIEFLKGPQGTLYGRNTLAGALNILTNRPDFSEAYGGANFSAESFNTFRSEGYANVPVTDALALRFSGYVEQTEGYVKNLAGPNLGGADQYAFRAQALFEPSDTASFLLRASRAKEEGSSLGVFSYAGLCRPVNAAGNTDQLATTLDCRNPRRGAAGAIPFDVLGPYTVENDFVADGDVQEDLLSLEANFDLGAVSLKSISSWTDYRNFIGLDGDASGTNFERFWNDERSESLTQELQLSSNNPGPFSWLAGAYFSNDDQFFSFLDFRATQDINNNPNGATALASNDIVLNGFFADSTWLETDTIGVFGQAEFAVSDRARLIGGLRYNSEDKRLDGGGSNFTANGPVTLQPGLDLTPRVVPTDPFEVFAFNRDAPGSTVLEEKFDKVTWKVAGEYDVNADTLAYATVSTGFLSGQLNRNGTITDQQESINYELGVKTQLAENTLQLNAAVFLTEYDNLLTQSQRVNAETGTVVTFGENGGDITAKGLEVDFVYQPDDQLTINGGASFLDSEYGTFGTGNVLVDGDDGNNFIDLSDSKTPWSPDFTANVGASYRVPTGSWGSITPAVNFFYSDGYQASTVVPFSEVARQDSYTKTDLRLTWDSPSEAYSVAAYVQNLEDEAVNARVNVGGNDFVQSSFLPPRIWGLKLEAEF